MRRRKDGERGTSKSTGWGERMESSLGGDDSSCLLFYGMVKLCVYLYLKHQSSSSQTCFRLDTSSGLRSMHQLQMI